MPAKTTVKPLIRESPGDGTRPVLRRFEGLVPHREGAFWVLFAFAIPRAIGPTFTILLRRFLGPGVSGLFDAASVPYRFLDGFRNFGLGPALVYERKVDQEVRDTAWTLNMLIAALVTALAQVLAHPLALYYERPEVEPIIRVLSIAYVFASAGSVHYFLLLRKMDFQRRSWPSVGQVVAGGLMATLFAVWGFGVGALVARELASVVAGAALVWSVYPYRPRIRVVRGVASGLMRYGVWVGLGLTLLYVSQNVDVFIGGRIIRSSGALGFYTTSWRLAFVVAGIFTSVTTSMVFPALSRIRGDRLALQGTLLKSIRQVGVVLFPASALLAVLAPIVIVPVLGERWAVYRSSFMVLSLLAVYSGNRTLLAIFFEGYKSLGKPWIVPAYNGVKLLMMVPAMVIGAEHGILGLALTYIPLQAVEVPVAVALAHHVIGVRPVALWSATRSTLTATGVMALVVAGMERLMTAPLHRGDLSSLALCLPLGIATYLAVLTMLDRSLFAEMRTTLGRGL